jgi:molybdopterin/thiamine biosynthesis adenylyltransferase
MPEQAIYERQNLIADLDVPQTASVIGCGGTGFWTALLLAMSGVEELILIDTDMVEVSNLNRLPLEENDVGKKKTEALKSLIFSIRKQVRIEIQDIRIEKPIDCQVLRGDIFCCTDNLKSQQIICAFCKKNDLNYQRIGYDGTILNVSKTFPLSLKGTEEESGYTVTPSWVIPAVLAAAAGVASRTYKELCLMDDLGKIHIQHSSHVCQKILDDARTEGEDNILDNIDEYIPEGYGYCDDCSRVDPDRGDYGYCPDCDHCYTNDDIEQIKEEAKEEQCNDIISQIETGEITDSKLLEVMKEWAKTKGGK